MIRKCIAQYPELGYQVLDVAKVVLLVFEIGFGFSLFMCGCYEF